ncbi:YhgE/Pip domain-containing protein [Alkalihalobacterium chitinilyticum]|uniref:YhgE/Pip domain-containing protein n=1 Tax=Alkalihalobacterium chitinilyticum TaxID=2980103 RepID=A0ABT5VFF6_9BACI|nr:YhgE/Pip domain-containing protein [Alkalihalobacterium chitinilyticum]MDE5413188.1 YhgE/Pip domain-containing protein [Alkalihalobacterium chitinilyticum]
MKKIITIVLTTSLLSFPVISGLANENQGHNNSSSLEGSKDLAPVSTVVAREASSKEEVVYGTLNSDGTLTEIYVVNMLEVIEPGLIIDHGNYTSVKNLTDLSEIKNVDGTVQFDAPSGLFYYQGNLEEAELPWDIDISYRLDGQEISSDELAGETGRLELAINTAKNDRGNSIFYENYTLQISCTLDTKNINIIDAVDANIAKVGKKRQVTYTVMPDSDGSFRLTADVTDFEMEGININAIPLSMVIDGFDVDEMTGEMRTLSDAIAEINKGVSELNNGVTELNNGVQKLRNGSGEYNNGIREISRSSAEVIEASALIEGALAQVHRELSGAPDLDLSDLAELPAGLSQMAKGLSEAGDGLLQLHGGFSEAFNALDEAMNKIPAATLSEEEIQQLYASGADPETVGHLIEVYTAAQTAKGTYNAVKQAFSTTEEVLKEVGGALHEMSGHLSGIANEVGAGMANMEGLDGLKKLEEGLAQLSANYGEFHSGLVSYTNGVGKLADAYAEIHSGIGELADGTTALESGVNELADGTDELADATSDLPDQLQEEVDAMLAEFDKSDFDPVSFVSPDNRNVEYVQFILKTEAIEIPDDKSAAVEEEEEPSFWQRLKKLFS